MKSIIVICLLLIGMSIASPKDKINLAGSWQFIIDKELDGNAKGNLGCAEFSIADHESFSFNGEYTNCQYTDAVFNGKIYETERGTAIHIQHLFTENNYVGMLSGYLTLENGKQTIKGVWSNMEGTTGDFKLIKK